MKGLLAQLQEGVKLKKTKTEAPAAPPLSHTTKITTEHKEQISENKYTTPVKPKGAVSFTSGRGVFSPRSPYKKQASKNIFTEEKKPLEKEDIFAQKNEQYLKLSKILVKAKKDRIFENKMNSFLQNNSYFGNSFQGFSEDFLDGLKERFEFNKLPQEQIRERMDLLFMYREGEYTPEDKLLLEKGKKDTPISFKKDDITAYEQSASDIQTLKQKITEYIATLDTTWGCIEKESSTTSAYELTKAKRSYNRSKARLKNTLLPNSQYQEEALKAEEKQNTTYRDKYDYTLPREAKKLSILLDKIIEKNLEDELKDFIIPVINNLTRNILFARAQDKENRDKLYIEDASLISRNIRGRDDAPYYKEVNQAALCILVNLWPAPEMQKEFPLSTLKKNIEDGFNMFFSNKETKQINDNPLQNKGCQIAEEIYNNYKNKFISLNKERLTSEKESIASNKGKLETLEYLHTANQEELTQSQQIEFRSYNTRHPELKNEIAASKKRIEEAKNTIEQINKDYENTINTLDIYELTKIDNRNIPDNQLYKATIAEIVLSFVESINARTVKNAQDRIAKLPCVTNLTKTAKLQNQIKEMNAKLLYIDHKVNNFKNDVTALISEVNSEIENTGKPSEASKNSILTFKSRLAFNHSANLLCKALSDGDRDIVENFQKNRNFIDDVLLQTTKLKEQADKLYIKLMSEVGEGLVLSDQRKKEITNFQRLLVQETKTITPNNFNKTENKESKEKLAIEAESDIYWHSHKYKGTKEKILNSLNSYLDEIIDIPVEASRIIATAQSKQKEAEIRVGEIKDEANRVVETELQKVQKTIPEIEKKIREAMMLAKILKLVKDDNPEYFAELVARSKGRHVQRLNKESKNQTITR